MQRLSLAIPILFALACTHPQTKDDKLPTADARPHDSTTTAPSPVAAGGGSPVARSCNVDLDCGARQLCLRGACTDITDDLAACKDVRVYFAWNSDLLAPPSTEGLVRAARCLKADTHLHVQIAGNADERGTEEYNLALGDKRAQSVAHYLETMGVSSTQLATVSYGEERPLCTEHDEACWAKNRRAEFAGRH